MHLESAALNFLVLSATKRFKSPIYFQVIGLSILATSSVFHLLLLLQSHHD